MSWIPITKATLYGAHIAALIDACDTAALAADQPPRAEGLIQGVVDEVRTAVATHAGNRVDADLATVPKNLRDLVVDMVLARLKAAIGNELSEDERSNLAWRRGQLKLIAAGELAVDAPAAPVEPDIEGGDRLTVVTSSPRVATREQMEGLL